MAQRVLLVNKFYYPRGGDCVVTLNTQSLLESHGHDVAVFSMNYPENIESVYSSYFATEVDFGGGIGAKLKAFKRTMGWGDVKKAFKRLLADFKPDVVHLHNIHSYLSPVLAEVAHKAGCRVVWTMHDYKLLCPSYSCLLGGKPCELCFAKKSNVFKHRCMKGSAMASAIAWLEAVKWNRKRLERNVDAFICPSEFMAQKMKEGGFDASKLKVLCNFVDNDKMSRFETPHQRNEGKPYYCYVGRLSHEKGVDTLLKAASALGYELRIAGDGPLGDEFRKDYESKQQIQFLGMCKLPEVYNLLAGARFSVIPSQWYENNPLSVIESLCTGTPVVGSRMGGIPELIHDNEGIVVPANDVGALREAIVKAWEEKWDYDAIGKNARTRFSSQAHYDALMKIYGQ
ncbi:MAG: glycosyltransferase [Muribaculaceae bacterium]|nr:glycosyltransferase [Muribaculaceae bacterium]